MLIQTQVRITVKTLWFWYFGSAWIDIVDLQRFFMDCSYWDFVEQWQRWLWMVKQKVNFTANAFANGWLRCS